MTSSALGVSSGVYPSSSPLLSRYFNTLVQFVFKRGREASAGLAVIAKGPGDAKHHLVHGIAPHVALHSSFPMYAGGIIARACLERLTGPFPNIALESVDVHIGESPLECVASDLAVRQRVKDYASGQLDHDVRKAIERLEFERADCIKRKINLINLINCHVATCKSCQWTMKTSGRQVERFPVPMSNIFTHWKLSQISSELARTRFA